MDTVLRMAKDTSGNLMLLWLSNPAGEMVSTPANLSTLLYSTWTGSAWTAPATVASNFAGIGGFTAARRGAEAFVIAPHDPDPAVVGDEVLERFSWTGGTWSAAQAFAATGPGHRSPSAAYDLERGPSAEPGSDGGNAARRLLWVGRNPSPHLRRIERDPDDGDRQFRRSADQHSQLARLRPSRHQAPRPHARHRPRDGAAPPGSLRRPLRSQTADPASLRVSALRSAPFGHSMK